MRRCWRSSRARIAVACSPDPDTTTWPRSAVPSPTAATSRFARSRRSSWKTSAIRKWSDSRTAAEGHDTGDCPRRGTSPRAAVAVGSLRARRHQGREQDNRGHEDTLEVGAGSWLRRTERRAARQEVEAADSVGQTDGEDRPRSRRVATVDRGDGAGVAMRNATAGLWRTADRGDAGRLLG